MIPAHIQLSDEQIERVVGFLGYGRVSAPVWFIGIEEGLGEMGTEEAENNLVSRGAFEKTMDLYEAHCLLIGRAKGKVGPIDFENAVPTTQVWKYMAKIMLAREGRSDWKDPGAVKEYIRHRLGRSDGDTFLTELSPIPAGRASDKSWMTKFESMDRGIADRVRNRKEELKKTLRVNSPALVFCYGKRRADDFADLLDIQWRQFNKDISESNDSRRFLLPFFGNGQMSHSIIECLIEAKVLN